jgi:colanic acid/amylovoran biosynthesis glycosyltransferase
MSQFRFTVLHYSVHWLKLTENWLYREILSLPDHVTSYVVCERLQDAESYPIPNLRPLQEEPFAGRVRDKAFRRLGLREHLEYTVRIARESSAGILHSHFGHVGWSNIGAARKAHVRHVVSFYGADATLLPGIDNRWRARYGDLFSTADLILCEGPHFAKRLEALGCPAGKIRINPLGVPASDIQTAPRTLASGAKLKILLAATFLEKKGLPDAIAALGQLKRSGVDFQVTILGDATPEKRSRDEKERILTALKENELFGEIRILGYVARPVLFKEAYEHHIFLSPSRTASDGDTEGGAPVTLIEMAATGMPVVSTRHCDIPSRVIDGVTGFLADEGDVNGLCGHLATLARNPELITRMGRAGRDLVEREFDASRLGLKLADIYRGVL